MTTDRMKILSTPELTVRRAGGLPAIDLTTDDVDAMGDRVIQSGLTFRTPLPILFAHQYHELPVGQATRDTIEQGSHRTRVAWRWLENDPRAAAVRNAFEQGMLGASIGMKILDTTPNAHGGVDILRAEGVEGSLTAIPANPACVRLLKDLGWGRGRKDRSDCPAGADCPNTTSAESCPAGRLCADHGTARTSWRGDDRIILIDEPDDEYVLVLDDVESKAVPSNVSTSKAPEGTAWSAPSLKDFTRKSWSDLSDTEKRHIAGHFTWSDEMPPRSYGSLKLPHHRPSDGAVVLRGVAAAAARLNQTEGIDEAAVKRHLASHYRAFGKTPPWEEGKELIDFEVGDLADAITEAVYEIEQRTYNKLRGRVD